MSTDLSGLYTTEKYTELNPTYHVEDSPWKAAHVLRMLSAHHLAPKSVVEVGCGVGEILHQLQERLPADTVFDGYEISPAAFRQCGPRANTRLRFHCEDLLATAPAAFELCLCMDVIEHVPDFMGFLTALRDRARYAIFHIPLDVSALSVLRGWPMLRSRASVGHIHYFYKDTALAALADTGYDVIDWFYTSGVVDRPQTTNERILRLPRRALAHFNPDFTARLLGGYSLMVLVRCN